LVKPPNTFLIFHPKDETNLFPDALNLSQLVMHRTIYPISNPEALFHPQLQLNRFPLKLIGSLNPALI
jgi:hypothetical protein